MIRVEFAETALDCMTQEATLSVYFNGDLAGRSQGTSADLIDFGIGYLLSQGYLDSRAGITGLECDEAQGAVWVEGDPQAMPAPPGWRTTSASGEAIETSFPRRLASDAVFAADSLAYQMEAMTAASPKRGFGQCVHCCALGSADGAVLFLREDVGRHNAVDKVIGHAWLEGIPLCDKVLLITGRISTEMAFKAYQAGVPGLVSLKSATAEAVRLADDAGLTLVSHCRDGALRVLTHGRRILTTPPVGNSAAALQPRG